MSCDAYSRQVTVSNRGATSSAFTIFIEHEIITHDLVARDTGNAGEVQGVKVTPDHAVDPRELDGVGEVDGAAVSSTHELGGRDTGNSGLIQSGAIDTGHNVSAHNPEAIGEIQAAPVGTQTDLTARDTGNSGEIQDGKVDPEHVLKKKDTRGNTEVEGAAADTEHKPTVPSLESKPQILYATGMRQQHLVSVAPLDTLDGKTEVESGELLVAADLTTTALDGEHEIEKRPVDYIHALTTQNLSYKSPYVPTIKSGELTQKSGQTGTYVGLPYQTVTSTDIYDEQDALAGTDAHDSINDQSDTRWLRPPYAHRDPVDARFRFDVGLPPTVDVTSIDTCECTLRAMLMNGTGDDTLMFDAQIVAGDNVTPLTDRVRIIDSASVPTVFTDYNIAFQVQISDPDLWQGSFVIFRWERTRLGNTDNTAVAVSQIYIHGEWTAGFLDYNLRSLPLIEFGHQITTPHDLATTAGLEQDDPLQHVIEAPRVLMGTTMVAGDLEQETLPGANEISDGKVDPTHALWLFDHNLVSPHEIKYYRIWHDLFVFTKPLSSTHEIQGDNVIEPHDLYFDKDTLSQTYNPIFAPDMTAFHLLVVEKSLGNTGEVEKKAVAVDVQLGAFDIQTYWNLTSDAVSQDFQLVALPDEPVSPSEIESGGATTVNDLTARDTGNDGELSKGKVNTLNDLTVGPGDEVETEIEKGTVQFHRTLVARSLGNTSFPEPAAVTETAQLGAKDIIGDAEIARFDLDTEHHLVAADADNAGVVEAVVVSMEHYAKTVGLDGRHAIEQDNVPVPGESLDGEHEVQGVSVEQGLDPNRFAIAMVIGA